MVIIYPVIELNDLVYAHRYGWLDALTRVTEGVMLRPEAALGPISVSYTHLTLPTIYSV